MNASESPSDITRELEAALERQRQAHLQAPYPSAEERTDRLDRLADLVVRHQDRLCAAANTDFGRRSTTATQATDLVPILDAVKHARGHLKKWMSTRRHRSNFPLGLLGAKSTVEYLPLGVVGNISPWNFPIQLALMPLAQVFAAGNRVMLKPSELSPNTSQLMAELVAENFDPAEFSVFTGGPEVASAFAALRFDHLLFTGSTQIGRLVAQAAAPNLVPLTLELGGKNPVIVSRSADLKLAAEKVMWAKTMNGGQICLCPDLVFVPEEHLDTFVTHCTDSAAHMFPDFQTDEEYAHIISERHAQRLVDLVADAEAKGADCRPLGKASGRCVPPTLILGATDECRVMQEEVFGGPLPIIAYRDTDELVAKINRRERPLALYYFGTDNAEIDLFTYQTNSGGMVINDLVAHCLQEDLPFGGVGESGMGAYHGFAGFKNFSHERAIYKQSPLDPLKMIRPPFSAKLKARIAQMVK